MSSPIHVGCEMAVNSVDDQGARVQRGPSVDGSSTEAHSTSTLDGPCGSLAADWIAKAQLTGPCRLIRTGFATEGYVKDVIAQSPTRYAADLAATSQPFIYYPARPLTRSPRSG